MRDAARLSERAACRRDELSRDLRFFGTEEVFADIDLAKAEKGAGFLAISCPQEAQAERIRDLVAPFEPLAMQLYLPGGIHSLLAGNSPGPQGDHPEQN